jgi:hypothetical protein
MPMAPNKFQFLPPANGEITIGKVQVWQGVI